MSEETRPVKPRIGDMYADEKEAKLYTWVFDKWRETEQSTCFCNRTIYRFEIDGGWFSWCHAPGEKVLYSHTATPRSILPKELPEDWSKEFFILPNSDRSGDITISHWVKDPVMGGEEPCSQKWEELIGESNLFDVIVKAREHKEQCND